MVTPTLSDEEMRRRYDLYVQHGIERAAEIIGKDPAAIRRAVKYATKRGWTGDFKGGEMPPGYVLGRVTSLVKADGTVMEWQHRLPEAEAIKSYYEELAAIMKAEITPLPEVRLNAETNSDLLTLYPIVDVHLGQHSWGEETGANYDLRIARDQFYASSGALMAMTPNSDVGLVVVLGDFFHGNDNTNATPGHKHPLDVDGRHAKVVDTGCEMLVWYVDMALQKHAQVIVHVKRGNHDPEAHRALLIALKYRYENNPRVTVDRSPKDLWCYEHGVTMLGFTHGDNIKAADMPGAMAAYEPEMWGRTRYRYSYSGHFHKFMKGQPLTKLGEEKQGATWEILPAFTEKDAYNRSKGFASQRAMVAKTFSRSEGLKFTTNIQVR